MLRLSMQPVGQLFSHINTGDSDTSRKRNVDIKSDYNNGASEMFKVGDWSQITWSDWQYHSPRHTC